MRWIVLSAFLVGVVGCGGVPVPQHSGYKSDKDKPWKKAKPIKLDDQGAGKADGDLNYAKFKRARWYSVDLPSHGELDIKLEITPPGDAVNEDFDLAYEVLDPGFRVIAKSDLEDTDAKETQKAKKLLDLNAGKYLVHLYLQGRMDTAEFGLRLQFTATKPPDQKTDFPEKVEFVAMLPKVNDTDEAPKNTKPTYTPPTGPRPPYKPPTGPTQPVEPKKPDDPKKPALQVVTARIVGVSVVGGGVQLLIGRGTSSGAQDGMKATLKGIGGAFPINGCNETTCRTVVSATNDQVKAAGGVVTLSP